MNYVIVLNILLVHQLKFLGQSVSVSVAPLPMVILPLIVCPFRQRLTSPSGTAQLPDTDRVR